MIEKFLSTFEKRFGIAKNNFKRFSIFTYQNGVWMASREAGDFNRLRIQRRGIKIARVFPHTVKPTTNGMQLLGREVKKNRIELNKEEALRFCKGEKVKLRKRGVEKGFVVVFYKNFPLGVGLYKEGELKSQVPRARRIRG